MRFSEAYVLALELVEAAQRSPEEMLQYYTQRLIYKPTANININDVWTLDANDGEEEDDRRIVRDESGKELTREDLVAHEIKEVVSQTINTLSQEGLLKYIEWVIYKTQDKRLPEDLENITETLSLYEKLKVNPNNRLQSITFYPDFQSLQNAIEPFKNADLEKEKLIIKDPYVQKHEGKGLQVVYNQGSYKVFKLTDSSASADLCRSTGWCVKDPHYFEHYGMGPDNPLYLISKDGYKYALINFETKQFKDASDRSVDEHVAMELYPIIKTLTTQIPFDHDFDVFKEVPGFKEEAISNSISNFNNLNTLADSYINEINSFAEKAGNGIPNTKFSYKEDLFFKENRRMRDFNNNNTPFHNIVSKFGKYKADIGSLLSLVEDRIPQLEQILENLVSKEPNSERFWDLAAYYHHIVLYALERKKDDNGWNENRDYVENNKYLMDAKAKIQDLENWYKELYKKATEIKPFNY